MGNQNSLNWFVSSVFWHYVKEHLSRHEVERYMRLAHITTDAGRGRAWLRSALNEHSLEKYMHMIVEDDRVIRYGSYFSCYQIIVCSVRVLRCQYRSVL